ncbi:MAG: hypothetical protein IPM29_00230 [Planctomycetes bacterium]|nr:hypothetical protein [Planctomycetota bacterium]
MLLPPVLSLLVACAVLGAAAPAQGAPPRRPTDGIVDPPRTPFTAPKFDPRTVVVDEHHDGSVWIAGTRYKACFDRTGLTYVPYLGADAPRSVTVGFRLRTASIDGIPMRIAGDVLPDRADRCVRFARGDVIEKLAFDGSGIEQSFELQSLPWRGELVLDIAVTPDASLQPAWQGVDLTFTGPRGGVRYGPAVAIDATGQRFAVRRAWTGNAVRLTVAADVVARATLPLVVDPVIGTLATTVSADVLRDSDPDLCYDRGSGHWLCVWQRDFSMTDGDVWSAELTRDATGVHFVTGSLVAIETSLASWRFPAVANCAATGRNLVVAQTSPTDSSPWSIEGRVRRAASPTMGQPFVIARDGLPGHFTGDKFHPDVGGDPNPAGPSFFAVVWERPLTPGQHDVDAKLVMTTSDDPSLVSPTPTSIARDLRSERFPSISNSCGFGDETERLWFIAYQSTFSATDEDIRGSTLTWDGRLGRVRDFSIDGSPSDDWFPQVSSASDAVYVGSTFGREAMVVWRRTDVGTPGMFHVQGRVILSDQTMATPSTDLGQIDQTPPSYNARDPRIDCDGRRYAVMFTETPIAGNDDVRISTFHRVRSAIGLTEARAWPANDPTRESSGAICSERSGGGLPVHYVAAWSDDRGTADDGIEAIGYDGVDPRGGLFPFGQGCGTVTLDVSGLPAIGQLFTLRVGGTTAGSFAVQLWGSQRAPLNLCGTCDLLVDGIAFPDPATLLVPFDFGLIGRGIDVQGVEIGAGPCAPISLTAGVRVVIQ